MSESDFTPAISPRAQEAIDAIMRDPKRIERIKAALEYVESGGPGFTKEEIKRRAAVS